MRPRELLIESAWAEIGIDAKPCKAKLFALTARRKNKPTASGRRSAAAAYKKGGTHVPARQWAIADV